MSRRVTNGFRVLIVFDIIVYAVYAFLSSSDKPKMLQMQTRSKTSPFSCPTAIQVRFRLQKAFITMILSTPKKNIVNLCCCRAISHSSRALRRVGPMKLLLALVPQLAAAIVVGSLPEGSDGLPVASGHRPGWLARSGRSVVCFPQKWDLVRCFPDWSVWKTIYNHEMTTVSPILLKHCTTV